MKRLQSMVLAVCLLLALAPVGALAQDGSGGYASPAQLGGAENIYLSYAGRYSNTALGRRTVEGYKPLVGYMHANGDISDIFFDSYLFLPFVTNDTPSGGTTQGGARPTNLTDWKFFIDEVFAKDANIDALAQATEQICTELGGAYSAPETQFRAKVFLSVMYPFETQTDFGDVDGDGVSENFSRMEDRKKAVKWMGDEQMRRYTEANYDWLDLVGFYWFEENFNVHDTEDKELITYFTDYVHSFGLKCIWIPYQNAQGYLDWDEVGFDVAAYQPNYMWNGGSPAVIQRTCDVAKANGMGVEIEIDDNALTSDTHYWRYMDYLSICAKNGANAGVKMYYNGGIQGTYYRAGTSQDARARRIYDLTYLYAKNRLDPDDCVTNPQERYFADVTFVSQGCAYQSTAPYTNTESGYGKIDGKELTDGVFGSSDFDTEWVAFHVSARENEKFWIDLDLGASQDSLDVFTIETGYNRSASIDHPSSVEYFVSDDGNEYYSIGTATPEQLGNYTYYTLRLPIPVTARYVRAEIYYYNYEPCNFNFVSEIAVGRRADINRRPDATVRLEAIFCMGLRGQTVGELREQFATNIEVIDANGFVADDHTVVGTGFRIVPADRLNILGYTAVLAGDADGNGDINAVDYFMIRRIMLETYDGPLTLAQAVAADANEDGEWTALDYFMVKRHVLGTLDLFE